MKKKKRRCWMCARRRPIADFTGRKPNRDVCGLCSGAGLQAIAIARTIHTIEGMCRGGRRNTPEVRARVEKFLVHPDVEVRGFAMTQLKCPEFEPEREWLEEDAAPRDPAEGEFRWLPIVSEDDGDSPVFLWLPRVCESDTTPWWIDQSDDRFDSFEPPNGDDWG